MNIQDYKGVFVFIETLDESIQSVSFELLGKGKELANELDTTLTAVLLTPKNNEKWLERVAGYGADRIVYSINAKFANYLTEPFTQVLFEVSEKYKPEIFLFGATALGRDLAPRLSARCATGLTADCTSLEIAPDSRDLLMTRPAFGGNLMATIICPEHRPQMATIRSGVMQKNVFNISNKAEFVEFSAELTSFADAIEILDIVKIPQVKIDIQSAKVLVAGGRGMGAKENMPLLEDVAELLHGTVAASRAVVDMDWIDKASQVGQTGKTVRPDLYIACGISGAIQHISGMEESAYIIAINKDETAPIFSIADLGIVGDVNQVLVELKKSLENINN